MGTFRGNQDQVMAAAAEIAARLRAWRATVMGLQREYHCAYSTLLRAILSQMTRQEWRALARQRVAATGIANRFRPGHVPWSTGRKIGSRPGSIATQFKKGGLRGESARKYRAVGAITVRRGKKISRYVNARRRRSERWIKVRDEGRPSRRWVRLAQWLWEQRQGPVPPGFFVVHADHNLLNDGPENLILVDRAEHARRLRRRPEVERKRQAKCSAALKARHRQRRLLRAAGFQTRRYETECLACGYDLGRGERRCPKCGGTALARRPVRALPGSMVAEARERQFEEALA
ncbi:MAG: HNH endonuclease signature motif containing protein [Planctomycetota bacterium]